MTGSQAKPKRWTFERAVAIINLVVLVVGATLTSVDWYPKWENDLFQARSNRQTPTIPAGVQTITDVKSFPDGSHLYDITYTVVTRNTSPRPVSISYSIAELYVGALSSGDPDFHQAIEINDPPNPWDPAGHGQIAWTRVDYDASLIDGAAPPAVTTFLAARGLQNRSPGGGLTGALAPGDSTSDAPEFLVRARPGEYVSLVYSYGLGAAVTSPSPDINLLFEVARLPPGSSAASGPAADTTDPRRGR